MVSSGSTLFGIPLSILKKHLDKKPSLGQKCGIIVQNLGHLPYCLTEIPWPEICPKPDIPTSHITLDTRWTSSGCFCALLSAQTLQVRILGSKKDKKLELHTMHFSVTINCSVSEKGYHTNMQQTYTVCQCSDMLFWDHTIWATTNKTNWDLSSL